MTRFIKAVSLGLVFTLCLSLCGFSGNCENIRGQVLRVHILANSDTAADQQLKLQVRDAVVKAAAGLFDGVTEAADAKAVAEEHLESLCRVAQTAVYQAGYAYPVTAEVTRMYFNTREYDAGTLPAGVYNALRIVIGKGEGQNWWCVAFPPLCVASATDHAATLSDVLTRDQQDMVERPQKYEVRLKVVEWVEELTQILRGKP